MKRRHKAKPCNVSPAQRWCLGCNTLFLSMGPANRICRKCGGKQKESVEVAYRVPK